MHYAQRKKRKMYKLYTTPSCGFCIMAKQLLANNNLEYEEVCIQTDEQEKQKIKDMGFSTVPQIWKDGDHVGGYYELKESFNES